MITVVDYKKDIFGNENPGVNTSYYGKRDIELSNISNSIKEDMINFFGKDCISEGNEGIIIGIEENNQFFDYYYIVYIPNLNKVTYELCNDSDFVKTIKK